MRYKQGHHPNSRKNLLKEPPQDARVRGGINSGEVRKKKRELQEVIRYLMDLPVREGDLDELTNLIEAKNKNLTVRESMVLAQIRKALSGDTQSFKAVADLSGERPKEQYDPADDNIVPSFRELLLGGDEEDEEE